MSVIRLSSRPHPEGTVGWSEPVYRHWPLDPGVCEDCDGAGRLPAEDGQVACWTCDGTGVIA